MPVFLAYGIRHCRRAKEDERKGLLLEGKPLYQSTIRRFVPGTTRPRLPGYPTRERTCQADVEPNCNQRERRPSCCIIPALRFRANTSRCPARLPR